MTTAIVIGVLVAALAGLGTLLYFILRKKKPAGNVLQTTHGITLFLSKATKDLTQETVEEWTESVIHFWHTAMAWAVDDIRECIRGTKITYNDVEKLQYEGDNNPETNEYAAAITYVAQRIIIVATQNKPATDQQIRNLFRHELSHLPAALLGNLWDNASSHKLFKDKGLGA